ncbi:MAG TPA: TonB-dependent receptor plug domain-containing protein, partial [Chitinophagaceae bacterium]|nr:TonB-dependent receptor plug domain-containing protein [Chitinophagaceae bacterium]
MKFHLPARKINHDLHSLKFLLVFILSTLANRAISQSQDSLFSSSVLKKLTLEELMNIEVTSVSKHPEKFAEVASAIQVITGEEIKRSGATNLPEALRLATNLQVSQFRSNAWIISARGFNAAFSNKLLVLIDGRTAYSPLFAGVFWDAQSVLLEDIDRIEIISGPGGSVWGANAVNGIINIITKNSKETKGLYASAGTGTFLNNYEAIRYGGKLGHGFNYRVYGQRSDYDNTFLKNGDDNTDKWNLMQGGFRMDWNSSDKSTLMLQGNLYGGVQKTKPDKSPMNGQNILGSYTHHFSPISNLNVQIYYDRTWRRDIPSTITDGLQTYDIDIQYNLSAGKHNNVTLGAGYRFMHDEIKNGSLFVGFLPLTRDLNLYSSFIQDEILFLHNTFKFTVGTKLQYYSLSDFSLQPSARLAWTPNEKHTIWAACSR